MTRMLKLIFMLFFPLLSSCSGKDSGYTPQPAMEMTITGSDTESVSLSFKTVNATGTCSLCKFAGESAPGVDQIKAEGIFCPESSLTIKGLKSESEYRVYCIAVDDKGACSEILSKSFTTAKGVARLYDFEAKRSGIESYNNLALCYGGSAHRVPFLWNQDRWSKQVFYKDATGSEHWLFDAFLAIEFADTKNNMSLMLGQKRPSATKESWQELIDYWFDSDNGFSALDRVVGAGIARIGKPKTTRKVVMIMPDAIIYQSYADKTSSTTYWGSIDGTRMDFSKAKDRITAMKWYIDQVRERWDKAKYSNLDLIGFYIISEDLAVPGDGWSADIKHWEDIYPEISHYLHSARESLNWIPYYKAGGYSKWADFCIDYAMMQPNYFWGQKYPPYTISEFKQMVTDAGMSMEIEFDDAMLSGATGAEAYRARVREYLQLAKDLGFFGTRELSYYMGQDTLYKLATSTAEEDIKLYRELCEFIMQHNTLRGK